jgi:type VI secretion system secreted protein VgrG
MDEKSSCWIRVATSWAGNQWGMVHIPRIGQEVVVDFLEGDPDQPIVVGSVFNADQMPPYFLGSGDGKSANPTQSGLKTHSTKTKEGDHEKFNELRFEDKQGSEEIYFHAEKDFHRVVENNDTLKVGGNKADDGSQTIDIYKNRTIKIQTGDETFDIEKGQRTVTIHKGDDALTIKAGNRTVLVKAGKQSTEAAKEILLKVGGSSIKIDQQGIAIKAMKVSVEAEMKAEVNAVMADINASGVLALKGGVIKIN